MRAHLTAAATAALLLGLVGCSAAPEKAPTEEPAASTEETTEVEPLTAEPVEEETPTPSTPEEAYLVAVRESLDPETTQIPDATDEQLLAAGQDACEQIAAGTEPGEVLVIDGEQPDSVGYYVDSSRIGLRASELLCP